MARTIWGIVRAGQITPEIPLPEGARVQIILPDVSTEVPAELQAELAAWDRASAEALKRVEDLAAERHADGFMSL
jgi:hypothetical protein